MLRPEAVEHASELREAKAQVKALAVELERLVRQQKAMLGLRAEQSV